MEITKTVPTLSENVVFIAVSGIGARDTGVEHKCRMRQLETGSAIKIKVSI